MNNDNTNQRKVKVSFNSTIEIVNIVRKVNEDVRDVAKDLDDEEGTHGVGEVDHADAEVEARDPPNAPRDKCIVHQDVFLPLRSRLKLKNEKHHHYWSKRIIEKCIAD